MTDTEIVAAIRKLLADAPATSPTKWWYPVGAAPTAPLADLTNEAELKRYAAHGFTPRLIRTIPQTSIANYNAVAERLSAALSPEAADNIIAGAGKFPTDVAIYLTRVGGVQGTGDFEQPSIFAPASIQTISAAASWATGTPIPGGPGPGF